MDLEDDLAAVFDPALFGVRATLRPAAGGAGVQVEGILDTDYQAVATAGAVDFALSAPQFRCGSASLPAALAEGWVLRASGRSFTVRTIQPDGTGVTTLILEAA